ncbi:MAG: DUF2442 domain-containing protein [Elusimicrobia bacterium]|nr:DUF2442 domain-containing protein [Elusimicrobiota bacterium]
MIPHIIKARYKNSYRIWLKFDDGAEGIVDLEGELSGEIFEPLKELKNFRLFHVDPELETLVWENGADLAPEFLREHLIVKTRRRAAADSKKRRR